MAGAGENPHPPSPEKILNEMQARIESQGRALEEAQAGIEGQARMIRALLDAQSGDGANAKLLRGELRASYEREDRARAEIDALRGRIAELERMIAFYESENMPTSTASGYNERRKRFRERRGEDASGPPGEPAGGAADGGGGGGSARQGGKRPGPPEGHPGVSHSNKATAPPLRYGFDGTPACPSCGAALAMMTPENKMAYDYDRRRVVQAAAAVIARAGCPGCGGVFEAPNPFLRGTSPGPGLLGTICNMVDRGCTDGRIARFIHAEYGFRMSENAVWNARKAIRTHLELDVVPGIMLAIQLQSWVQMDESKMKRGDGQYGYVGVAYTPVAVFLLFTPTRAAAVLEEHFARLRGKPVTCDGFQGYPRLTGTIQRDFVHVPRRAEKLAVDGGDAGDGAGYDMLKCIYHEAKQIRTLAPFTVADLSRRAHALAASYPDRGMRTYLANAVPDLFTFLARPGMSPHSNDVERKIRDAAILQRNTRHKLVSAEGRDVFSTILTFNRTCHKQRLSPGRALIETMLDGSWNLFEKAGDTPYSVVNPDGTHYTVFSGLDLPTLRMRRVARQDQADTAPLVPAVA